MASGWSRHQSGSNQATTPASFSIDNR